MSLLARTLAYWLLIHAGLLFVVGDVAGDKDELISLLLVWFQEKNLGANHSVT